MSTYESGLVDSNVLVYAALKDSEHFHAANAIRDQALNGTLQFFITPQILAEFFAIITDPRRVSEPRSNEDALKEIEKYLAAPGFALLPISADVVLKMIELCRYHPVKAQEIFDVQIAANMLVHGIRTIYTFNRTDFEKFDEITVVVPT